MTRPAIEVADIVRARGRQFLERFKASLDYQNECSIQRHVACKAARCMFHPVIPIEHDGELHFVSHG